MKRSSKGAIVLLEAYMEGYRVNNVGELISKTGKKLSMVSRKNNYVSFTYRSLTFGSKKHVAAHKLMAYQKYGDKLFEDAIEVRHIDGNKLNNSFDNIVLGTRLENIMDIPAGQRKEQAIHAASFLRKDNKRKQAVELYKKGLSYNKIKDILKVSKSSLSLWLRHLKSPPAPFYE